MATHNDVLYPVADGLINSSDVNTNFGSWGYLEAGQGSGVIFRSLVKFDLSGILLDAGILDAFILVYLKRLGANTNSFGIYRLKRNWVEAEFTWNIYSTGNNWQTPGAFGANDCEQTPIGTFTVSNTADYQAGSCHLDVSAITDMVRGVSPNYGFLIKSITESDDKIISYAKENGPTDRTYLGVSWSFSGRQFQSVIMG